jgi:hypothetical protein
MYYVYVLLNPLRKGKVRYGRYVFTHMPFYVGKGSGKRIYHSSNHTDNKSKKKILRGIKAEGEKPLVRIYREGLTEDKAYTLEKQLVQAIGRMDLKVGPLTNRTNGGSGHTHGHAPKGKKHPRYGKQLPTRIRRKISDSLKEYYSNGGVHPLQGKSPSKATRKKISSSNRKKWTVEDLLTGNKYVTHNLKEFCSQRDLHFSAMRNTATYGWVHKNRWRCKPSIK